VCSPLRRGVPNISLESSNYRGVADLISHRVNVGSGTSCSTIVRLYDSYPPLSFVRSTLPRPSSSTRLSSDVQTAAAVISLLNDYCLSKGEAPLGFFNPWLYGFGCMGFNGITSVNNPGCNTAGLSAIVGWDPVRPARPSFLTSLILNPIGHRPRVAGLSKTTNS
jgi:hypothetical protein